MAKYVRAYHRRLEEQRKAGSKKTERAADSVTNWAGSWNFLLIHIVWFALWLGLKLDINLLTLIVSLEAIILMNVLLMSQTRQAKKDDLRDEADYQSDRHAEEGIDEIRKIMKDIQKKIK